jgi:hypothetical protein
LRQSLEHYLKVYFTGASFQEKEDLKYILEDLENDKNSDFYQLQNIVDTETLGKLKKQAQINYLEFLLENIQIENNPLKVEGSIYLQDLIRRLKSIETYINDTSKADGDYIVNYGGVEVNYRDMFSRAEAFDSLPIIPKIEGYLGEIKDNERGKLEFVFGIKLKLDVKVQTSSEKTTFQSHIRGCFKSSILCHAERSVSPPDDLRYAKRVLSISVYVQNPRFYSPSGICSANVLLRSTQNDKLYPVRLFKHPLKTLNPDDKLHQEALFDKKQKNFFARRVLKIAFLYFFVFASRHNPIRFS